MTPIYLGDDEKRSVKTCISKNNIWLDEVECGREPGGVILIKTLEGVMKANPGDYIIRGVKGGVYPCEPDIFEQTYEKFEPNLSVTMASVESVDIDLFAERLSEKLEEALKKFPR